MEWGRAVAEYPGQDHLVTCFSSQPSLNHKREEHSPKESQEDFYPKEGQQGQRNMNCWLGFLIE